MDTFSVLNFQSVFTNQCTSLYFRLYKELGDYDVLRGIFSNKVGTKQLTMEAMEAEMRSDYVTARNLYSEVLWFINMTCTWGANALFF